MKINRRDFIRVAGSSGITFVGGTLCLANGILGGQIAPSNLSLPSPNASGIQHVVVVTMENRSFDHFLGWLPNANAQQIFTYPTASEGSFTTERWPDYQGCGHPEPDHSYSGGRVQYDNGKMDGWLLDTNNDIFAIGYYNESDLPFTSALARNFTTLDNYFCSILGPTFPNRIFMLTAQTDRLTDNPNLTNLPTIFDRLIDAGVQARYYFSNVPFLALWGLKYALISRPYDDFLSDAASGRLPAVSYVDPSFSILDDDEGNDDHPHSNIQRGESFLAETFKAVASGPAWSSTVFVVTFDEWGGFFDHVSPQRIVAPNNVDTDMVAGQVLLGFRVPTIVASPWTLNTNPNSPLVNSTLFDHTSILRLIEWRWGLNPLTTRDVSSELGNVATTLNFTNLHRQAPSLPEPAMPPSSPCGFLPDIFSPQMLQGPTTRWSHLKVAAQIQGWKLR